MSRNHHKSGIEAPWQIVWCGISVATTNVELCGRPSLPHNFKGNKSMKILVRTIFAMLGNCQGQYFSILIKVPNNETAKKFITTGLNIGKMWPMAAFFQRPELRRSCGIPAANNLPKRLTLNCSMDMEVWIR